MGKAREFQKSDCFRFIRSTFIDGVDHNKKCSGGLRAPTRFGALGPGSLWGPGSPCVRGGERKGQNGLWQARGRSGRAAIRGRGSCAQWELREARQQRPRTDEPPACPRPPRRLQRRREARADDPQPRPRRGRPAAAAAAAARPPSPAAAAAAAARPPSPAAAAAAAARPPSPAAAPLSPQPGVEPGGGSSIMPGAAAALLALCALALCGQPARSQILATGLPPEDLDGSGDDDDGFSGSGAGASSRTFGLSLLPSKTPVLTSTLSSAPAQPPPSSPGGAAPEASSVESLLLPGGLPEPRPAPSQEETLPSSPTFPPTTHWPLTVGAPGALDPALGLPMAPSPEFPSSGDEGLLPSAPESGQPEGSPSQHPGEESSGSGSGDFTFAPSGDNPTSSLERKKEDVLAKGATGASQGILDRKEVLGGVIAGGLVGLIFAAALVGFMLYRMRKKDEGSYSLEEPKQANGAYQKPQRQEEFYA
ncbi:syndecan-1 [Sminthopsis crassicaudata]|uniref:syndecan-1 n=1 Tax=Sminthopsis crassicaudata TaxID=9301 RepID=UPI003D69A469